MERINTATFSRNLNTPLAIGKTSIPRRLFLAPMAGLGHIAFRQLVSELGGFGLLFTGMCSARAVPHENPKMSNVFAWRPEELSHTVCQIFGGNEPDMVRAAERIEAEGFFGVDLNFGCSVAAICKKGCGAALLKDPPLAGKIVAGVRKAVNCPVFVKFRAGWENQAQDPGDMARRFEDAGADALVYHPRTAPDRRTRPPKWELIRQVEQAVAIPVFGNGNLFDMADGVRMLEQTGCQGLCLGRMAVARPWIFAQWTLGLTPDRAIYHRTALRLADLLSLHHEDHFAVKLFKKFAPYFCANFKFGHSILKQLIRADTMADIRGNIEAIFSPFPETLNRPNMNLFL